MSQSTVNVAFDDLQQFIRVAISGVLTDTVLLECSRRTRELPEFRSGFGILVDLSGLTSVKITSDAVVQLARAAQKDKNKIAIVTQNPTAYGVARTYEIVSDLNESRVRVLRDEASALQWVADAG